MSSAAIAQPRAARITKRLLTRADHERIQQRCQIDAEKGEDYACVFLKGKGYGQWSVHVFHRQPTQKEIDTYEQTASKLKFKGAKAEMEGSQITAAANLYNALVARAYDVLVGLKSVDVMGAEEARARVGVIVKREAIRQLVGEVYGESRLREAEGADDEDGDDDPEAHTSGEPEDSEL